MTAERVETAIERISAKDAELGRWARYAADGLTAGEGEEIVSQASLQSFLWYYLPKKCDEEIWSPVAEAAGVLLDELGLQRYATIARSPATTQVLDSWRRSRAHGFRRYKAAMRASCVEPIDTPSLAWGQIMGSVEADAMDHVERALERAIGDGTITPGAKGSMQVCIAVSERALGDPVPGMPGQSWLSMIISERASQWVSSARSDQLRARRESIAKRVMVAPEPPADPEPVIAAMRWLLQSCTGGVELTQAGYLPTKLVQESLRLFFESRVVGSPRSEVDVVHLSVLRETAVRMRAVAKRRRVLNTTAAGERLAADPIALWRAIAANFDGGDAFSGMVSELIAHRLIEGPAVGDELDDAVAPILLEQGWHANGMPLTPEQARGAVPHVLYSWRLFGLLDEERPRWESGHPVGQYATRLSAPGPATALAFLHFRATRPRKDLFA